MAYCSRRTLLKVAGAVPFTPWLAPPARAQDSQPRVRYDARSPRGVEMLQIYAAAVGKMKDPNQIPPGDPRSWLFQWYTHFVNDETTKAAEIARIYTNPNDPNRSAAVAMWNTCQAHSPGQVENYFLPWHRCFVYYFEQIIAAVSGRPDFTLPYWNYSTSDPTIRGVIPPQFRMQNDPAFGPLFDGLRNSGVNQGRPIQRGQAGNPLSLDSLSQATYGSSGARPGFNMALDRGLHGNVHVLVGGPRNMGNVPTAGRDPIFWMHHCNIDRLWASWNAAGHVNPSLSQTFTFAGGDGKAIVVNIANFLDIASLGYTYDRFEPVPGGVPRPILATALLQGERLAAMAGSKNMALGASPTRVLLEPPQPAAPANAAASVRDQVMGLTPGRRVFLVARDLRAATQPGVLYNLYLDLPENPTAQQLADHFVGTINFFAAHHGAGMAHDAAPEPEGEDKFLSFDVTSKIRALGRNRVLGEKPVLTVIPQGQPAEGAQPVLGQVDLVLE